jgi:hypothetical protein
VCLLTSSPGIIIRAEIASAALKSSADFTGVAIIVGLDDDVRGALRMCCEGLVSQIYGPEDLVSTAGHLTPLSTSSFQRREDDLIDVTKVTGCGTWIAVLLVRMEPFRFH